MTSSRLGALSPVVALLLAACSGTATLPDAPGADAATDAAADGQSDAGDAFTPDTSPPPVEHDPRIVLSAETLTFTRACASKAGAQTITVSNLGDKPVKVQAAILDGAPFVVSDAAATLAPRGMTTFTVTPGDVSADTEADFSPHRWDGHLELRTDIPGDSPRLVALTQHIEGSRLVFDGADKAFPDTRVDEASEKTLTLRNVGSSPATVSLSLYSIGQPKPQFEVTPSSVTVAPNATADVKLRYLPRPEVMGAAGTTLEVTADATSCGASAHDVWMTGSSFERVKQVAIDDFTCVLSVSGRMYCSHNHDPVTSFRDLTVVPGIDHATKIGAGWEKECALLADKTVACVDANATVGFPTQPTGPAPYVLPQFTDVVDMSVGGTQTCAVQSGGTVRCIGYGANGALGDGSTAASYRSAVVQGLSDAKAIAVGYNFACALRAGGTVACWGSGATGVLGGVNATPSATPIDIVGLSGIVGIAATTGMACALAADGTASCWGADAPGAVKGVPMDIGNFGTLFPSLALGAYDSCVLSPGPARCWGSNSRGELAPSAVPKPVDAPLPLPNDRGFIGWASGTEGPCAIDRTNELYCWGYSAVPQRVEGF